MHRKHNQIYVKGDVSVGYTYIVLREENDAKLSPSSPAKLAAFN